MARYEPQGMDGGLSFVTCVIILSDSPKTSLHTYIFFFNTLFYGSVLFLHLTVFLLFCF